MKRPRNQIETMEKGYSKFQSLSIEDQCKVLSNLLLYFGMGSGTSDLSLIGGAPGSGALVVSSSFKGERKLVLHDQCITGLFEKTTEIEV